VCVFDGPVRASSLFRGEYIGWTFDGGQSVLLRLILRRTLPPIGIFAAVFFPWLGRWRPCLS
jgi:hypothetical protein